MLDIIKSASQLEKLKEAPEPSRLALKKRAEADLSNIAKALHSQAYFGAYATFTLSDEGKSVILSITKGPLYPLAEFEIRLEKEGKNLSLNDLPHPLTLESLHVQIGQPALPERILSTEELLLEKLKEQGFAFASIQKREAVADQASHTISITLFVQTGPLSYFGPIHFTGLDRVKQNYFYRRLKWREGEVFDPKKIEKTEEALQLSGLFRSIQIHPAEAMPDASDRLPIEISVSEAKQRSIGFGLNYTTSLGPGLTTEWEDRNILGEGEKLSFRSNIWQKLQEGSLSYLIPEFAGPDQNLIWMLKYKRERTKPFTENDLSFSGRIEKKVNEHIRLSYGGMYEHLTTQRSSFNGTFNLLKIPLQFRWSAVDNVLEPTRGFVFQASSIPSLQILHPQFAYCINNLMFSTYYALREDKRCVFATKWMFGSTFGASKHEIPPPDRFFAGSESTLRGYRYLTVSPLRERGKEPIGGRSMLIYSMELRNRIGKNLGLVLFYDVGNVYQRALPKLDEGWRQSAGVGIRYYTPIGPLRLDVAFPLNKRKIDQSMEAYFSIGQSF